MNIEILKQEETEFYAKVIVPAAEITKKVELELNKVAKKAKFDGFRPGKVPMHLINKKYKNSIHSDTITKKANEVIQEIIKTNNLTPLKEPQISDVISEENKDFEMVLKFELLPKVTIPDFEKIKFEKPELEVTDKMIDEKLDYLAKLSVKFDADSKEAAETNDQVTLDAIGYVDGEAFDGGKLDDHKLVIGSKMFVDNFEDQLIGKKAGDDVTVKVTFPENYPENLANKKAEFKVKVKAVKKGKKSKIDDEFAVSFKAKNLEDLKNKLKAEITQEFEKKIYTYMKMKFFDHLEDKLKFSLPDSLVDREEGVIRHQSSDIAKDDPKFNKKSEEEKDTYFKKIAIRRVRIGLMLAEYINQNELKLSQEDIFTAVYEQAKLYPGQEKKVLEFYQGNREALESITGPALEEKAVEHIFANKLSLEKKSYTKKQLENMFKKKLDRV